MNVNVHIERLVLEGFDLEPGHPARITAAVEAELTRLLAYSGLAPGWERGGATPYVTGNPAEISSDGSPSRLGQGIARAVYGGIGK